MKNEIEYSLTDWYTNRLMYNPSAKTSLNSAVTLICKALDVPSRPGLVTANSLDNMTQAELFSNIDPVLKSIRSREIIGSVTYIPTSKLIYGEDEYSSGFKYSKERYVIMTIQGEPCAIFFVAKEDDR